MPTTALAAARAAARAVSARRPPTGWAAPPRAGCGRDDGCGDGAVAAGFRGGGGAGGPRSSFASLTAACIVRSRSMRSRLEASAASASKNMLGSSERPAADAAAGE